MKITLLTENSVSEKAWRTCIAEWGLSALIEFEGKKILFDTGMTYVYIKNAKALGVDLEDVDVIALSHKDPDHIGGLKLWKSSEKKQLVAHPITIERISGNFEIKSTSATLEFLPNAFFLGEIPRVMKFEIGQRGSDKMLDDSALAFKTKNGTIVVITGCSHPGICNICEYAKKITGQKLYAVIGGFHLSHAAESLLDDTINYFKSEKLKLIYPMHCVDMPALSRFYIEFGITKVSAGDTIKID